MKKPGPRQPRHFTPLRYPGGKGKLAAFIKATIKQNHLLDGDYAEAYAGGAGIALELLFHEYVANVHVNDLSKPIFAFWNSVLTHPDQLSKLIFDTPLTMKSWDKQKKIFAHHDQYEELEVGFATFFLNRTNRSGILNGGVIGGREQTGPWKIDARFNREELVKRIEAIAKMRRRINLSRMDAVEFLKTKLPSWPSKTLIYLDPPYFVKGRELYYDFYQPEDHEQVEQFITGKLSRHHWIVSYDNVPTIRSLYKGYKQTVYGIGYSARDIREGSEIMFFSDSLEMPRLVGPFRLIRTLPAQSRQLARSSPMNNKHSTARAVARKNTDSHRIR
jgi:DNA adenine methylase